jgi:hypothetical protein
VPRLGTGGEDGFQGSCVFACPSSRDSSTAFHVFAPLLRQLLELRLALGDGFGADGGDEVVNDFIVTL